MAKTLILGASTNPQRYSYLAAQRLLDHNEEIVLVGGRVGELFGHEIMKGKPALTDIDTVTLYVGAARQDGLEEYLKKSIRPRRVIFNPGTENRTLASALRETGIETLEACTLVMLASNTY